MPATGFDGFITIVDILDDLIEIGLDEIRVYCQEFVRTDFPNRNVSL